MTDNLRVFCGGSNPALATEICQHLGMPLGEVTIKRFSNDNIYVQIQENVRERDVFVIQSFTTPVSDHILELLILLDALRSASARRITAVIPYFSYSRSDKKDHPRISIAGRLMADLLKTAGANRVLTMNLHADQVHGFFSVPTDHLTAVPVLAQYFLSQGIENAVAVAPDAGHAKRVGIFAEGMRIPMAFVDKRRLDDLHVRMGSLIGNVEGKNVIVFDDEIAAASSMVGTVETVLREGAKKVYVGVTHGVLCGPAMERISASPIERVVVTNTVAVPPEKRIEKLEVLSVAPLFAEAIKRIHSGESVGALFA
ncbi:MAG TPA: ribose-phosphate pyrophosphokinase [Armatimonadota bacterium]|jgi:ribose-phosphate pyrophosphokinase